MRMIDHLSDIQQLLANFEQHYDICIHLTGQPVDNRYPRAAVRINGRQCWTGTVNDQLIDIPKLQIVDPTLSIEIEYQGKTDLDTKIQDEAIVQNQTLNIQSIRINHILISRQDLQYMGRACYNLSPSQQKSYAQIGATWIDVKTDTMYNNGVWKLEIKKPILSGLIALKNINTHVFEVPHQQTLARLQQSYLGQ